MVVFGETTHDDVNPVPHLWVRGKAKWIGIGFELLTNFFETELQAPPPPPPPPPSPSPPPAPPPPPALPASPSWSVAPFDGREYGAEYLVFDIGVELQRLLIDPAGWAFGILPSSGAQGWYPAEYATSTRSVDMNPPPPVAQRLPTILPPPPPSTPSSIHERIIWQCLNGIFKNTETSECCLSLPEGEAAYFEDF